MRTTLKYWKFYAHFFFIIITVRNMNESLISTKITNIKFERFLIDIKHILIWTDLRGVSYRNEGQVHFINKKCSHVNCYFTKDRNLFGDVRYFDAIVFNASDLEKSETADVPKARGKNQVYIFAANDSAEKYPVCNPVYDGFFNWTWTYRHDSTISYRFISIYNNQAEELGSHFQWYPHMDPVGPSFKSQLITKYKAAAVFLDECTSHSDREGFIYRLKNAMRQYNLTIDVYGKCGTKNCRRRTFGACSWRLKKQYFFLLTLEDSIAPDFITEAVVTAYKNNVVPIVYGGANYSQFLPPNSYINGKKLSVQQVAAEMYQSIKNKDIYHEFFRWRNHYDIRKSDPLDACALCSKLSERPLMKEKSTYDRFREWWWPGYVQRCWVASANRD